MPNASLTAAGGRRTIDLVAAHRPAATAGPQRPSAPPARVEQPTNVTAADGAPTP
jgi:hypothetical protein